MTSKTPSSKPNRVTNVQVPGETLAANEAKTSLPQATAGTANEALTGNQSFEDGKPIVTDADVGGVAGDVSGSHAFDIEAIRAQAKAEALSELQADFEAAKAAMATAMSKQVANAPAAQPTGSYRDMRADQVDPAKLTAPVLTKDGWVCPSQPPAVPAGLKH